MSSVSVIIPTYNRLRQLVIVLEALAHDLRGHRDVEVIVVSDGSTDGTDDYLVGGDAPIAVVAVTRRNGGAAAARNAGVAAASGDLIVFLDDDVVPEPGWLMAHVAAHAQAERDTVVVGPLLTPEGVKLQPWVKWEQVMLYKQYDAMARGEYEPTPRQFYTGNASLGRELFLRAGTFDEGLRRAEDVELAYRLGDLGASFDFVFEARARHFASRSYESWLDIARSYGRNDVVFWRDRGQRWLVPTVREEFETRNPWNRGFTRVALAAPRVGRVSRWVAGRWANGLDALGFDAPGRRMLSAVYTLTYMESLIDEIGGPERFFTGSWVPACP